MTAKIFHTVYEIWNPLTLECIYVGKGNEKECAEYDALHRTSRMMAYELLTDIQKKNRNEYWAKKRNKDNN